MHCWIDGEPAAQLPADDRGLAYGDGLFETMAGRSGRLPHWRWHLARLQRGCKRLGITCPSPTLLLGEAQALALGDEPSVIKLIVTRGSGGRGYAPPHTAQSRRILSRHAWPQALETPLRVITCATRLSRNPSTAGIKHLNRLEQVMARRECVAAAAGEGLMLDTKGNVIEATSSNLILRFGEQLVTPSLKNSGVAGIMRARLMRRLGPAKIQVRDVSAEELPGADELILSNAIFGLRAVAELDGRAYRCSNWAANLQLNPLD